MAKKSTKIVRMVSTESPYTRTAIVPERAEYKLELNMYDPVVRKHVLFKQAKIKS